MRKNRSTRCQRPIMRCLVFACLLLLTVHCSLLTALGQSNVAALSGEVVDQNGAVIPGATVMIVNPSTGFTRETTTNDSGYYTFPSLAPGSYSVTVRRDGFAPIEIKSVVLNVGDQKALQIQLKAGDVNATVQVINEAPLIDDSPAVGTVVDRQFVGNLPLNGRSFQQLITLTPGVVLTKTNVTDQGQFSVNGQRADANYFTVDGVSANIAATGSSVPGQSAAGSLPGLSASGGTNNLVSVDALQEFRVLTSSFAAEYGRTPGGQVSIVTRSGTNQFHGTAFDYFRNDVLDANDWFANANRQPKPKERQNDFGGVFGGPLFLPRFGEGGPAFRSGKNKTFFFFSYEGLRLRQPQFAITDVPSLAARVAAPLALQPLVNMCPKPNAPDRANGLASFSSSFSNPSTLNATSVRIDGKASGNLTLFGRYNYAPSHTVTRGAFQPLNDLSHFDIATQTLTVGATYLLAPTISNDLRFNYSRNKADNFFTLDDFGGAAVPSESAFFPSGTSTTTGIFEAIVPDGQEGTIFWGQGFGTLQRQINLVDGLSIIKGSHQVKVGADYRRLSPAFTARGYSQVAFFSSIGTPGSTQPRGTVLSGVPRQVLVQAQKAPITTVFDQLSLFAQDIWKVTPRLTLTYGLRWEYNPPPHGTSGNDALAVTQVNDPATMAFAPAGAPLWKTTYGNFAPRVGAAYQLKKTAGRETVLKGGFGVFYDLGNGQAANGFDFAFPFTATKTLLGVSFPLTPANAAAPVPGPTPTSSDNVYAFDPNLKLPRIYQWNVSIEQALGANQSFTASYVAAVGRRLLRQQTITNPSPGISGIVSITKNTATSDYHGLQLQFQRRLTRGLQSLLSYSWSKSLDIASSDASTAIRDDKFDPSLDRGPSDFDVRHSLNGAVTYSIPTARFGRIGRDILSGWLVDGIVTARSATPVNVTYSPLTSFGFVTVRPDLVAGVPLYVNDPTAGGGRTINAAAFAFPSSVRQGTLGRNAVRGFAVWQVDFALHRQISLGESVKLQIGTEFFNVLNHPNFADPTSSLGFLIGGRLFPTSGFGRSLSMLGRSLGSGGQTGGFSPLYQVGGPRSIQAWLKLVF